MQYQLLWVMCACVCTGLVGWNSASGVQQCFLPSKLMALLFQVALKSWDFSLLKENTGCFTFPSAGYCRFALSKLRAWKQSQQCRVSWDGLGMSTHPDGTRSLTWAVPALESSWVAARDMEELLRQGDDAQGTVLVTW